MVWKTKLGKKGILGKRKKKPRPRRATRGNGGPRGTKRGAKKKGVKKAGKGKSGKADKSTPKKEPRDTHAESPAREESAPTRDTGHGDEDAEHSRTLEGRELVERMDKLEERVADLEEALRRVRGSPSEDSSSVLLSEGEAQSLQHIYACFTRGEEVRDYDITTEQRKQLRGLEDKGLVRVKTVVTDQGRFKPTWEITRRGRARVESAEI